MFAVMPLSSPKYASVLRPASSGSHDVTLTDAALIVAAAAFVLAALAPSAAFVIVVVAAIGGIAWIGARVAASAPKALVEAHRDALSRATSTQISFAR